VIICGLDECGRGSLAGPLVACGVVFHKSLPEFESSLPVSLRDSKLLSPKHRNEIFLLKDSLPISYLIHEIDVEYINTHGIGKANVHIFEKLIPSISAEKYLVDGNLKFSDPHVESIIKGDTIHPEIMLASILAKAYRDSLMSSLHTRFPLFDWDKNAGYGTKSHIEALKVHGPSPYHRLQFVNTALKRKTK